jgi:hypothetical protein
MDFKSKLRELKIAAIDGNFTFNINDSVKNKFNKELDFILANFKGDIISGSLALNLYGLIDRPIGDIDILIKDKNRFSGYYMDNYDEVISNRLGSKEFWWKKNIFSKKRYYIVDFFIDNGTSYQEFEYKGQLLKVHHPFEVLSQKISMHGSKHNHDLYDLFTNILL